MRRFARSLPFRGTGLGPLACCGLSLALGTSFTLLLLAFGGGPASAAAPAAPSATLFYPGCGPTIQGCLNVASPGSTLVISAGTYLTSVTLSTAVSLTGVNSATVILQALANQRVLTVTGAAVNSSVVISGLTFKGGSALGGSCPAGCGGGLLITGTASPRLQNLIITGNSAGNQGGGLYTNGSLTLTNVQALSNTALAAGGGGYASIMAGLTLTGGRFQNNQCTAASCTGGGLDTEGTLTLTGTQFVSNTAGLYGGGAYALFAVFPLSVGDNSPHLTGALP